jgi:RNA polymerase sigma-70 factor (ECF subfamily)
MKHLDDQASWEEFFNRYWKLIYTFALKAGLTPAEAQDVVQETMATVARRIKDFEVGAHRGSFKTWLLQTTRWRIADQFRHRPPSSANRLRSEQDQTPHTPTAERLPDPASLELNAVWDEQWRDNLRKLALANLKTQIDPIKYQMFDLHVLKGLPARVVARKLGVNLNKIYFAKYKVARLLKKKMKELEDKLI